MNSLKIIFFGLFIILIYSKSFAIDSLGIDKSFNELFPGKKYEIVGLTPLEFGKIIANHFKESPQLRSMDYQLQSTDYTLKALGYSFSPAFLLGLNYNNNSQFHREVIVNTRVPVEWDNENPIISNINLPNGGVGIIWLPRPIGWAYKDIPINASDDYRDQTVVGTIGLTKKYDFGLQLNATAYSLNYRIDPVTYGFPWSNQMSASFTLPLMKDYGYEGSQEVVAIEKTRLGRIIESETINNIKTSLASSLLTNYIQIALIQKQLVSVDSTGKLLDIQIEDVDMLTQNGRITVVENLNVKNTKQTIYSQSSYLLKNLVYLSSKLNVNPVISDSINIYLVSNVDIDNFLEISYNFFNSIVTKNSIEKIIEEHPQVKIAGLELMQSEIDMNYARNQARPDISLTGSVGAFEQSRLGYGNPLASAGGLGYPDGLFWNLGVNYTLPVANAYDEYYQASVAGRMSQEENQRMTRRSLADRIADYIFGIKSSYENLVNAKKNLKVFQNIYDNEALPLFESQRMNRYDYSTYLIQLENTKMNIYSLQQAYFSSLFQFTAELNIDINQFLK